MPESNSIKDWLLLTPMVMASVAALLSIVFRFFHSRAEEAASKKVDAAEEQAFVESGNTRAARPVATEQLFNLYSKQIQKYQTQTQWRARSSFWAAIIAMFVGFGFLGWGGYILIGASESKEGRETVLAAGGIVSALGGAISGYIAKTFLDVHRLALSQLNHYFRQPLINDYILMGQRLADQCGNDDGKMKGYDSLIEAVASLVRDKPPPETMKDREPGSG